MFVFGILSLVLLPLAAATPYSQSAAYKMRGNLERRLLLSENAAASQFNFAPLEFRNICMDCDRANTTALYSCILKFNWYDPNSVRENNITSGTCNSTWAWDGVTVASGAKNTYSTDYSLCFSDLPSMFEMKFVGFLGANNFTLEVAHRYKDDQNFTAPYDWPLVFAEPNFGLPVLSQTNLSMTLYSQGPQYAKINAISD